MKKFADHPVRICRYPEYNGNIVAYFTNVLPGTNGNYDRDDKRWKDHGDTQWPPDHAPADIFKKPEHDVEVFHFAVANGNAVCCLFIHGIFLIIAKINRKHKPGSF